MARAARVTLLEREVRERLSSAAVEILLEGAVVLSEGERGPAGPGRAGEAFFGSTMLTIDLARAADRVREPCDPGMARRLAALMAEDGRVTRRLRQIVLREATRLCGAVPPALSTDIRLRTVGTTLYIDVDFEAAAAS